MTQDVAPEVRAALDLLADQLSSGEASFESIKNIANSLSVDLPASVDTFVFYSGNYLDTDAINAHDAALSLAQQSSSVGIIDNTHVAQFLAHDELTAALRQVSDFDTDLFNSRLFIGPDSLWGEASSRYGTTASGNVIALTPFARNDGIWATTEFETLINNADVDTINGINRQGLLDQVRTDPTIAPAEELAATRQTVDDAARMILIDTVDNGFVRVGVDSTPEEAIRVVSFSPEFVEAHGVELLDLTDYPELSDGTPATQPAMPQSGDLFNWKQTGRLLGALGVAGDAFEFFITAAKADELASQGDHVGAAGEWAKFAGSLAGGVAGAEAGVVLGAFVGPWGSLLGGVGLGIVGSIIGEEAVDQTYNYLSSQLGFDRYFEPNFSENRLPTEVTIAAGITEIRDQNGGLYQSIAKFPGGAFNVATYNPDGTQRYLQSYDTDGTLTRLEEFSEDGSSTAYWFDAGGDVNRIDRFGPSGERISDADVIVVNGDANPDGAPSKAAIVKQFKVQNGERVGDGVIELRKSVGVQFAGNIGSTLGSQIGNLIAGDDPFLRLASNSVIATIGRNLGEFVGGVIEGGSVSTASEAAFGNISEDFVTNVKAAGVNIVSSLLTAELSDIIGLGDSFGDQLISVVINAEISTSLSYALNLPGGGIGGPIAGFLGSKLADVIYSAETTEGQIGGALGAAIGGTIGSFILPVIGTGIGTFLGKLLGSLVGDLFGDDPDPRALGRIQFLSSSGEFAVTHVERHDGGNRALIENMSYTVRDTANAYLDLINGELLNGGYYVQVEHQEGLFIGDYFSPTGARLARRESHADGRGNQAPVDVLEFVTLQLLQRMEIAGGNLYIKRALAGSQATTAQELAGDVAIAGDYAAYLQNKGVIDAIILIDPESAFAAGWIITLLRAEELGITDWQQSDFHGGLKGFLAGFRMDDTDYDNISVSVYGTTLVITRDGDEANRIEIADFENKIGYALVAALADGAAVTGTADDDIWVAADGVASSFTGGAGGDDILIGSTGDDTINGGAGRDWINGGGGSDTLSGGADHDVLIGEAGTDTIHGNDGDDWISGGADADALYGDADNDFLKGGDGADIIDGGAGNDTASFSDLTSGVTADLAAGTAVRTVVEDDPATTSIDESVTETDTLVSIENAVGTVFGDALSGDAADNVFVGLGGDDTIDGRAGTDTVDYTESAQAIVADLGAGTVTRTIVADDPATADVDETVTETDTLISIEAVIGSLHSDIMVGSTQADILYGSEGDDSLAGAGGDDTLEGGAGDDVLEGGLGADILAGGDGTDTATYDTSSAGVTVDLAAGTASGGDAAGDTLSGIENLRGSAHDDVLKGDDGTNILSGGVGTDALEGGGGDDIYVFGRGFGHDSVVDHKTVVAYRQEQYTAYRTVNEWVCTGTGEREDCRWLPVQRPYTATRTVEYDEAVNAGLDVLKLGDGIGFDDLMLRFNGDDLQIALKETANPGKTFDELDDRVTLVNWRDENGRVERLEFADGTLVELKELAAFTEGTGVADLFAPPVDDASVWLNGFAGDDVLVGSSDDDILVGGADDDSLQGGLGGDQYVYRIGDGHDVIEDAGGADTLVFGGGISRDQLNIRRGTYVPAASGNPAVFTDEQSGVDLRIEILDAPGGATVLGSIVIPDYRVESSLIETFRFADGTELTISEFLDEFLGTAFDDVIDGDELDNSIYGGGGNDTLNGKGGSDVLSGGSGADVLDGGGGADFASYSGSAQGVTVDLELAVQGTGSAGAKDEDGDQFTSIENLIGSAHDDVLKGDDGTNILSGGAGTDALEGRDGDDVYVFGRGFGHDSVVDHKTVVAYRQEQYTAYRTVNEWVCTGYGEREDCRWLPVQRPYTATRTVEYDEAVNAGLDVLKLGDGIGFDDLMLRFNGDDLQIALKETANPGKTFDELDDRVTLVNWRDENGRVERLEFADGTLVELKELAAFTEGTGVADLFAPPVDDASVWLNGFAGDDVLVGSSDDDILVGGADDDSLQGGLGGDQYVYRIGDGHDVIEDAGGADTLVFGGGISRDQLNIRRGTYVPAASGNPAVFTDEQSGVDLRIEILDAPGGATVLGSIVIPDYRVESSLIETFRFADGTELTISEFLDEFLGTAFDDVIDGDELDNSIYGGSGNDTLNGKGGSDVLAGDSGADVLDGGEGADFASYSGSAQGVTVDLELAAQGTGSAGAKDEDGDQFISIENLIGSAYADTLKGDEFDNVLIGGEDGDTLIGRAGNDTLDGGVGADTLDGGEGSDTYIVDDVNDTVVEAGAGPLGDEQDTVISSISYVLGDGVENLRLASGAGAINATGNAYDNVISGNESANTLDGGLGTDVADYGASSSGVTVDLVAGTGLGGDAEGDVLSNIESVTGSAHADVLTGDGGANALSGGAGDDTLTGGAGSDLIAGGEGTDVAVFAGVRSDYTVVREGTEIRVSRTDSSGDVDILTGIETLRFDDGAGTVEDVDVASALPVAADGSAVLQQSGTVAGHVAGGDVQTASGSLVYGLEGSAGHGAVMVNADGTYSYTADAGYTGTDVFRFRVTDGDGFVDIGEVAIEVVGGSVTGTSESQVNTYTSGAQYQPSVSGLSGGGHVVVWTSYGQDGSVEGIYGQRYGVDGTAAGSEFQVNTYTSSTQYQPVVTGLDDGGFVVAWASYAQSSTYGIYGQRYDAAGAAVGAEFQINTYTSGEQREPSIASLSGGGFVVVWHDESGQDGSHWGVFGQRFDSAGVAVGAEFQVTTYTSSHQYQPSVTGLNDGGFVVTWPSHIQDGSHYSVFGQRYDAAGAAVGAEFQINTYTSGAQREPSISSLSDGGFVVIWQDESAQDGSDYGIYGQRYGADGVALGSEFQVNTYTSSTQYQPVVTGLDDGGFVVTWSSYAQDGSTYGIYGQRYDANGGAVGSEFQINDSTSGDQEHPSISALPNGGFVVVWVDESGLDGNAEGVYRKVFSADGQVVSGTDGIDTLHGGSGHDTLTGGAGADTLDGGLGTDVADYGASSSGVTVDLVAGTGLGGDAEGDVLSNIESVTGSAYADVLTGDGGANALSGGGGDDTLTGGAGSDLIAGGEGTDIAVFAGVRSDYTVVREGTEIRVSRTDSSGDVNILTGIETLRFDDGAGTVEDVDVASALPVAADGSAVLQQSGTVAGHVAGGDVQTASGSLVYGLEGTAGHGTVTVNADGTYSYTAQAGFTGTDVFRFRVTDGDGFVDIGEVAIEVVGGSVTGTSESQVNSYTSGAQYQPSVSGLSGGGHVVVWTSYGQDGSVEGIYGQRYGVDGTAVGAEFQVNTYTSSTQYQPVVTGLDDGGFVVAWASYAQSSTYGIYGQRYDAAGAAVGAEFQINTYTSGEQREPSIASLSGGGFVVVWHDESGQDGSHWGVFGQRFDSAGVAVGAEFQVTTYTSSHQYQPSVTGLNDGGFVVTWPSHIQDGSHYSVFGQRYDAAGAAVGAEFQINTYTSGAQREPSISSLSDGGFVVIWQDESAQDGSDYGIYGQRYGADGVALGSEFQVNTYTSSTQYQPVVTGLDDGGFVVTWSSYAQDGSIYGIYGQRYDANGGAVGSEFQINDSTSGDQEHPSISALPNGGFVVVWVDESGLDGNAEGVYRKVFSADGQVVSGTDGIDTLHGGSGHDTLTGGAGADTLDGGLGTDVADYSASSSGVTVDLVAGTGLGGDAEGDVLSNIESVTGSAHADVLTGDGGANALSGGAGDDTLTGGAGSDLIAGGEGTDVAVFAGVRSDYTVVREGTEIRVSRTDSSGDVDILTGIETLRFDDGAGTVEDVDVATALPVAADGSAVLQQSGTVAGHVAGSDAQTASGSLVYGLEGSAGHGAVTVNADGTYSYTAQAGFTGTDVFRFRATDGDGFVDIGEVAIEVVGGSVTGTSESQVNTYTSGAQYQPSVSGLSGGGHVVVWTSYGQDGSVEGIYGQRYGVDGTAAGSEFQVNTYTSSLQYDAAVTGLSGGGFVVTWSSDGQDGNARGVFGQRYDATGAAAGSEFQVNTATNLWQHTSSVTALSNGGFVVTWTSWGQYGNDDDVYGQRYDANGVAVGSEFRINTYMSSHQRDTIVSGLSDGGFIVAWVSDDQDGSGKGIYGQRYDAAGAAAGAEFQISTYTSGHQREPVVTSLSGGGFVVVWHNESAQDGDSYGVFGQRYEANGIAAGSEFQVNTTTSGAQQDSSVTALDDGGFVVTWTSTGQDGDGDGVYGQRYDANGGAVGSEFLINATTSGAQNAPFVTALSNGGFVVTWVSDGQDGSGTGIYRKMYSSDGQTLVGTDGIDTLHGGSGHDTLTGGAGADTLDGGLGADIADYSGSSSGVTVDLVAGTGLGGDAEGDVLSNIEGVTGSAHADVLTGDGGSNLLSGGGGDDTLTGGAGSDLIVGGEGTDVAVFAGVRSDYTVVREGTEIHVSRTDSSGDVNILTGIETLRFDDGAGTVEDVDVATALPAGRDGIAVLLAGQTVFGRVAGDDGQTAAGSLVYSLERDAEHGSVTVNTDGTYSYTPGTGYTGADGFKFRVTDGDGYSDIVEVTIDVRSLAEISGGEESQVNTFTANQQYDPALAALADGGYLVVWSSDGQDGSGYGIYGQRYGADDAAVGAEFQVNTYTSSNQYVPSVAALDDGGFVVTWASNGQDGSSYGIYGQRYDSAGAAVGSEFRANSYTTGEQNTPSVAALEGGGFVVTWRSANQDGSHWGSYGQIYDSAGVAVGSNFRVNQTAHNAQYNARVIGTPDGGFWAVWQSFHNDVDSGIYSQRFSSTGARISSEFRVNSYDSNHQQVPSMGLLADGGVVIVWMSNGEDGSGYGVYGQRYDASGAAVGGNFRANTYTASDQSYPVVTGMPNGGFVIAWMSDGQDGSGYGVYGQHYDPDGVAFGAEFQINETTNLDQDGVSAVTLSDGRIVLAWRSEGQDGSGDGVFTRVFTVAGEDLVGGPGDDALSGHDGDDTLTGGAGADTLDGGRGVDIADYSGSSSGVTVDLVAGTGVGGDAEGDVLSNIEGVTGSAHADVLTGDSGANVLSGGAGDDTLTGGAGADILDGGAGSDTYQFSLGDGTDTINNVDTDAGSIDLLAFGGSIDSNDLWFAQADNDLVVSVLGTLDKVTVDDWFDSADNQLDQFQSGDGKILNAADVQQLVSAMAAFQPNDGTDASGVLPDQLPTDVQVAVDANWQSAGP